jgi:hypothetical protein
MIEYFLRIYYRVPIDFNYLYATGSMCHGRLLCARKSIHSNVDDDRHCKK